MDPKPHVTAPRFATLAAWLFCLAILVLAAWQIRTAVSGQDDATHRIFARTILTADRASPEFRQALTHIAPGWPLFLALAIRAAGPWVTTWINVALAGLLLGLYLLVLRRVFRDDRAAGLGLLATLLILLRGYTLNAHFLLYAFRETPSFLFVAAGWLIFLLADSRRRPALFFAGGCAFVIAAAMREPAVCGAIGPYLWLLCRRREDRVSRKGCFIGAILPWLLAGGAWLVARQLAGGASSGQWQWWSARLLHTPAPAFWIAYGHSLRALLGFLWEALGFPWLLLGVLGVAGLRRNRAALWFFLFSALAYLLLYATYTAHRRYALAVLLPLCPFAAYGLHLAIEKLSVFSARLFRRPIAGPARILAAVLLAAGLVRTARGLQSWGPRIARHDVEQFGRDFREVARPEDLVVIEPICRHLGETLIYHLSHRPADPARAGTEGGAKRCFYLEPLTRDCFPPGSFRRELAGSASRRLRYRYDVQARTGPDGRLLELALGGGRYGVYEVRPWSATNVSARVTLPAGNTVVLWLDFKDATSNSARRVEIRADAGAPLASWLVEDARFLQAFIFEKPAELRSAVVDVSGHLPGPADFIYAVVPAGKPARFDAGPLRSPSLEHWFEPSFVGTALAMPTHQGGRLRPPPVHGSYRSLNLALGMKAPPFQGPVSFRYEQDGRAVTNWTVQLPQAKVWTGAILDPEQAGRPLDLFIEAPGGTALWFATELVQAAIEPAAAGGNGTD